jgi:hypothetical protein
MIAMQLRAVRNWLNLVYRGYVRRYTLKAVAWLRRVSSMLFFVFGWLAITWSMFLWNPRAWAASIGILLLMSGLTPVIEAYVTARARSRSIER